MSKKDSYTYQIVIDFITGKLKRTEAAQLLEITPRTVSRRARKVEAKGVLGIKHGNFGKTPVNKTPQELKQVVMELVKNHYYDFNMSHGLEKLKTLHGIGLNYDVFRSWCHEAHLVKRKHKRRPKARYYRARMPHEGLLLQMDGSHHRWNRQEEWCLIAAIDDATSDIPYGEFFLGEETLSCMKVMRHIIELKGIPEAIYVDRAGVFGGMKRQGFSQFKRACEELGIKVIFANSPQAKGRIERAFQTLQDRLIPEMRSRHIHRIPAANNFLQTQFIPTYWKIKNTVPPRSPESRYHLLPKSVSLDEVFCIKEYRFIKYDHTIGWQGKRYQLISPFKYSISRQQLEIRTYPDQSWRAFFAGKEIKLLEINFLNQAA